MVGTMWVWVTVVLVDEPQRLLGVPPVHQHDGGAEGQRHGAARTPAARRGTAARCTGARSPPASS